MLVLSLVKTREGQALGWSREKKRIYIAAAAVFVPLALFLRTFSASPLPRPQPYMGPMPTATPPKEMAVFSLLTGVNHRVARPTVIAGARYSSAATFRWLELW